MFNGNQNGVPVLNPSQQQMQQNAKKINTVEQICCNPVVLSEIRAGRIDKYDDCLIFATD